MKALVFKMASRAILANAVRVSLVVGTCLNLINQSPAIWQGGQVDWLKLLMNYAVPFFVASYSAARAGSVASEGRHV